MGQITASLRRRCYLWTRFLLESDGKEALWGDIREIRLEQVGQESGEGFSMEGIDLTFGLGRKYAIVGRSGSGKSGIIRLPTQYGPDDTGRILVNGRELSRHIDTIRG